MGYVHKKVVGVDVIELDDSVDLYSVPELKKFCKELLKKESKRIVINMEKLKFIDSSGLGMLVNLAHECKQTEVGLKLASMSPEAERTFNLTKMQSNFEIFGTVNEAIRSFG
jgi:anti-sigma B factor antagonist